MHQTKCILLGIAILAIASTTNSPATAGEPTLPNRAEVLQHLRIEHPRLLATRADFGRLAELCDRDERSRGWLTRLRGDADKLLSTPPVKYEIPDGKRLLSVSRRAKDRLLLLGLMYQLSGEAKYAERAWRELDTVTRFKDWNPSHFLDTAEMTFAVAIGYDWLYDAWSQQQRDQLRKAIVEHGLEPGLTVYRNRQWWSKSIHNWNQVCNGGMAVGALAIGDVEPELASEVLHSALHSLPLAMNEFRPDGGWGEGPGYWRYATEYNVYALAALQAALGTDFGLSEMPGFAQTGDFPIHFVGPTGQTFNFADAHDRWHGAPQWFWLADRFEQPAYAAAQLSFADEHPSPLDLLWGARWSSGVGDREPTALPLARYFEGVSVVTLRGAWDDSAAWFVAFKGGDNRVNHGHLDLGTFVLDAYEQRWAIDLGPDDYNLPGYFGRQRWTYFRNNTQSHNTLVIDGQNQSPSARAKIVRFAADEHWAGSVADLSAAWPQLQRAWRGVALIDGRQVLVHDEITADKPVAPVWQMLTDARIKVDGRTATLSKGGQQITAKLIAPENAQWTTESVQLERPQRPVSNVRKLLAAAPQPVTKTRFVIVFAPAAESIAIPEVIPLDEWPNTSP